MAAFPDPPTWPVVVERSVDEETLGLIREFEGFRSKAYQDDAGVWTIGYGTTKGVKPGDTITREAAENRLRDDAKWALDAVSDTIRKPITPRQRAALVSLAYNIGPKGFKESTAARKFNEGDLEGAADGIRMWNKITVAGNKVTSKGLVNRREAEAQALLDATLPKFSPSPKPIKSVPDKSFEETTPDPIKISPGEAEMIRKSIKRGPLSF